MPPVLESIENDKHKKDSFEIIEKTEELYSLKEDSFKSVQVQGRRSEDSSDDEFDIVSKTEIEEAKEQDSVEKLKGGANIVQHPRASINIQSASSSDTESESDREKSRHSSADHSETSGVAESQDETPVLQETVQKPKNDVKETEDSPVVLRSHKISATNELKAETAFSRPSSSDYSDVEHHADTSQDKAAASVRDKISIFNQESVKSRPSSSDF